MRRTTELAIEVGKMISELDPAAAAVRDRVMFARQQDPAQAGVPQYFALIDGIVRRNAEGAVAGLAGDLVPQGRVSRGDRTANVRRRGRARVRAAGDVRSLSGAAMRTTSRSSRSWAPHVVRVLPGRVPAKNLKDHEVVDTDGVYLPYLTGAKQVGALVRPDFYLYGTAASRPDLSTLVKDLRAGLRPPAADGRAAPAADRAGK